MEEEEEGEESEGKEGGPALKCIFFCLSFYLFPWCNLFSFAALGWRRLGGPTMAVLGKDMAIL